VLVLTALYYFGRPDVIGVFTPLRGWRPMTAGTRPTLVHCASSAALLALVPVLLARWLGRLRLRDLGLGLGRWREGLCWLVIGIPLAIVDGGRPAGDAGRLPP